MGQALRPPRNRPNRSIVGASVSSSELDLRGIPSGRAPTMGSPAKVGPHGTLIYFINSCPILCNLACMGPMGHVHLHTRCTGLMFAQDKCMACARY